MNHPTRATLTIVAPTLAAMQRQEVAATRVAVLNHHGEEGCDCTAELRRRYGVREALV